MTDLISLRDQTFQDFLKGSLTGVLAYSDYLQENDLSGWEEVAGLNSGAVESSTSWWAASISSKPIQVSVFEAARRLVLKEFGGKGSLTDCLLVLPTSVASVLGRSPEICEYLRYCIGQSDWCFPDGKYYDSIGYLYGLPKYIYGLEIRILQDQILPDNTALVHNSLTRRSVLITGV